MHACIHTYMHTCTHAYMHTCIHAYMHTCIHAYMHTCIHAYMHTYIRYITLHYITLHYITLHYITLHYITYIYHIYTYEYIRTYAYMCNGQVICNEWATVIPPSWTGFLWMDILTPVLTMAHVVIARRLKAATSSKSIAKLGCEYCESDLWAKLFCGWLDECGIPSGNQSWQGKIIELPSGNLT